MTAARLRVGVIGCGRVAQDHLQALSRIDRCEIAAVADVVERQAQSVAEQFACQPYADYRHMVDDARFTPCGAALDQLQTRRPQSQKRDST